MAESDVAILDRIQAALDNGDVKQWCFLAMENYLFLIHNNLYSCLYPETLRLCVDVLSKDQIPFFAFHPSFVNSFSDMSEWRSSFRTPALPLSNMLQYASVFLLHCHTTEYIDNICAIVGLLTSVKRPKIPVSLFFPLCYAWNHPVCVYILTQVCTKEDEACHLFLLCFKISCSMFPISMEIVAKWHERCSDVMLKRIRVMFSVEQQKCIIQQAKILLSRQHVLSSLLKSIV